jgi:hypothetical protein
MLSAAISAETGALTSAFYSRSSWPSARPAHYEKRGVGHYLCGDARGIEKHTVLTTPSDGCAIGDACAGLRRLHAIILLVPPHCIQDAAEASREGDDGHSFPATDGELLDPDV